MPKVKTNSSAKKRFKVTGTGEITFQKAFKRHILTKKSTKRKRAMRKKGLVGSTNKDFVLRLLRLKGQTPLDKSNWFITVNKKFKLTESKS